MTLFSYNTPNFIYFLLQFQSMFWLLILQMPALWITVRIGYPREFRLINKIEKTHLNYTCQTLAFHYLCNFWEGHTLWRHTHSNTLIRHTAGCPFCLYIHFLNVLLPLTFCSNLNILRKKTICHWVLFVSYCLRLLNQQNFLIAF